MLAKRGKGEGQKCSSLLFLTFITPIDHINSSDHCDSFRLTALKFVRFMISLGKFLQLWLIIKDLEYRFNLANPLQSV